MQRDLSTRGLLLLAAALWAVAGCATRSPHNADWFGIETPHFDVVSALDPAETRILARDLELFHAGVEYIMGRPVPELPQKTRVYAFDGRTLFDRPFVVRGESGYFLSSEGRPILVLRAGGSFHDDATELMLHDYTHFLVRQGDRRRPLWYEEGIAQLASTIEPRRGHARVAPPRMDHVQTLRDWNRTSVDATLEATDLLGWTHRNRDRFVAESWALAHYATLAPTKRGGRERPLSRFRHALDEGAQPGQSARIAFGSRGEELASQLRGYVTGNSLNIATVVPRKGWKPTAAAVVSLSRSQGRLHLGNLSLALGRPKNARRYFRMVGPEDVRALVGLAATHRQLGDLEEARRLIEDAVARAGDDTDVVLEAGRVYQALAIERPDQRTRLLRAARAHYARAAELDPSSTAALSAHASSYLVEGEDPNSGVPLVTAAYRQLSGSLELQLLFAQLEAKRGKRSPALLHATDIASRGHDLAVADAAQDLLESLRRPGNLDR